MVLKHYPLEDARLGIRFLVNLNIYPVCQSLKNKLRVGAGQTVMPNMYFTFCFRWGWVGVASLMVQFLEVSCYSGRWIFGLSLFPGLALGFLLRSGVIMGLSGCGLAFGFRFPGRFGLRVMGDGEAGSLVGGCGFWGLGSGVWGLGSGALFISDYK